MTIHLMRHIFCPMDNTTSTIHSRGTKRNEHRILLNETLISPTTPVNRQQIDQYDTIPTLNLSISNNNEQTHRIMFIETKQDLLQYLHTIHFSVGMELLQRMTSVTTNNFNNTTTTE
jgi:hypothetical protein